MKKLTHSELTERLDYDPLSGEFKWIDRNTIAGYLNGSYWYIGVNGRVYRANRLAWFYMVGQWPEYCIDHKDNNPLNNTWENLRDITHSKNQKNKVQYSNNKSGYTGIRETKYKTFTVEIGNDYLGAFKTLEEAIGVRVAAEKERGYIPK